MNYHYYKTIETLSKKGSIPGLESIGRLLDELHHPERQLKIIHIAGTNGKGSIFAFLSSIYARESLTIRKEYGYVI